MYLATCILDIGDGQSEIDECFLSVDLVLQETESPAKAFLSPSDDVFIYFGNVNLFLLTTDRNIAERSLAIDMRSLDVPFRTDFTGNPTVSTL